MLIIESGGKWDRTLFNSCIHWYLLSRSYDSCSLRNSSHFFNFKNDEPVMLPLVHEEFTGLLVLFGADGALVRPVVRVYLHVVL